MNNVFYATRGGYEEPREPAVRVGHVIEFTPQGTVHAMHNDKVDLGILGKQSIERATEIKFCEECQTWGIYLPPGDGNTPAQSGDKFSVLVDDAAKGFATYEGARQVEVEWLNRCRLENVSPRVYNGILILKQTRSDLGL